MLFIAQIVLLAFVPVNSVTQDCGEGFSCSDSTTCCRLPSGEWGCCPFPNAVCCSDHIHCCPQGTQCDPEKFHCTKTNGEIFPPRRKGKAQQSTDENEIICPDRRSKCPSGSTCCMLVSGKYGCCPVEGANCCADHLHCCPSGFTCDTSGQRCIQDKNYFVVSSYRKFDATPLRKKPAVRMKYPYPEEEADELTPVRCGPEKICPALTTCCEVHKDGKIHNMCCPLQDGVCCEDTCCPAGYSCRRNGRCEKKAVRQFFSDFSV
ncbi:hypothetical protein V3C99_004559 [Haemonchus contortus]